MFPIVQIWEIDFSIVVHVSRDLYSHIYRGTHVNHGGVEGVCIQEPEGNGNVVRASCHNKYNS